MGAVAATGGFELGGSLTAGSGGRAGSGGGGSSGAAGGRGGATGGNVGGTQSGGSAGASSSQGGSGGFALAGGGGAAGSVLLGGAPPLPEIPREQLVLWLAADRDVVQADDGGVSKWLDQSERRAEAAQVPGDARPGRIAAAQNGLPMLEFDGKNDWLGLAEGFDDFSSGLSFFAVVRVLEATACSSVMQFSNGIEIEDIDFGIQRSIHYEVAGDYMTGPAGTLAVEQTSLLGFVHALDGGVELRIDGRFMLAGTSPLPAVVRRDSNFVGRSLYTNCPTLHARVGEILLYARPLDDAERLLIEQYLGKKWGCCSL